MKILEIDRQTWLEKYQANAFLSVFGEEQSPLVRESFFDRAFLVIDKESDIPIIYVTIKQITLTAIFIEYGGSFPDFRGSPKVKPAFKLLCDWFKEGGTSNVSLTTRNTNVPMQRLALSTGFIPMGMHMGNDGLLLNYALDFKEEK